MPVTIKSSQIKVKGTDGYVGVDALADSTTASRISAINSAGASALEDIQSEGQSNVSAIEQKGAEVLESIPDEYTQLEEDVSDLKSAITRNQNVTITVVPSVQLFDRSKVTTGRMDKDGTINTSATSYVYTEKISVTGHTGETIYFSNDGTTREASRVTAFVNNTADSSLGASSVSTYTVPATVEAIVISYEASRTHFQAQYGAKTDYIPYGDTYIQKTDKTLTQENVAADALAVKNKLEELQLDDLVVSVDGSNLCNPQDNASGLLQSDGTVGTSSAYDTSDFIAIEASQSYNISSWYKGKTNVSGRIRTALYNDSKTFISGSYTDDNGVTNKTITNTSAAYIRFSFTNGSSKANIAMIIKGSSVPETFSAFFHEDQLNDDIYLNNTQKNQIGFAASGFDGKKWCPCGDSFTDGSESATFPDGKYAGKNKVYPFFIGNRTGMDIQQKFFLSGRTLAYPSDGTFTNSICCPTADCYYQNIPADVDYVTFYLGINDSHHQSGSGTTPDGEDATGVITLGSPDSTDTSTYYGAWNTVLTWLRSNRPFAHIGIIVTNGVDQTWREAQIAMARKYGVPFIDMNGDDFTPAMIRSCNANIPQEIRTAITNNQKVSASNQHPNDDAHEFESWFIEDFLKRI